MLVNNKIFDRVIENEKHILLISTFYLSINQRFITTEPLFKIF